MTTLAPAIKRVQRRTVLFLTLAQVFSGVATGAAFSVGSLLAVDLSGSEAWAGSVSTTVTLGAAIASALLIRLAVARGRRITLSAGLAAALIGAVLMIAAASTRQFWLLLIASLLIGAGTSVNLQARFAATDLSEPRHRGRDLSLIVWMSTVGSVAGPNLIAPGQSIAETLGIPDLSGVFVISAVAMVLGFLVIWIGLRPDPLLLARELEPIGAPPARPRFRDGLRALAQHRRAGGALVAMVVAHFAMVAVMAMTPVHLLHHGAEITVIGLTISLHIAGMFALSPVMGLLADRIGAMTVAAGGLLIVLAAALIAGLSGPDAVLTTIGLVLLGVGWSAATVAGSTAIVDSVPRDVVVAAQGVADTTMSLAGALGGVLAGLFLAWIGYAGLGIVCALLAAVAIPVVIVVMRGARPQAA
ncbi:MAG TPA: MFS transporter [Microbacteriaceae bacterium]|nr:MFS transporter [Microbacteriaceae bacterium]